MTQPQGSKRSYDSSRRRTQAGLTRSDIIRAARGLFERHGYAGATLDAIATEAQVSLPTVYAAFGTKSHLLIAMARLTYGGGEERALLDRAEPAVFFAESRPERLIPMLAEGISGFLEEIAPVAEILKMAAKTDPSIADFNAQVEGERWKAMHRVAAHLSSNLPFRSGVTIEDAADLVGTLASAETFTLLTKSRGYSPSRYRVWLESCLDRLLKP